MRFVVQIIFALIFIHKVSARCPLTGGWNGVSEITKSACDAGLAVFSNTYPKPQNGEIETIFSLLQQLRKLKPVEASDYETFLSNMYGTVKHQSEMMQEKKPLPAILSGRILDPFLKYFETDFDKYYKAKVGEFTDQACLVPPKDESVSGDLKSCSLESKSEGEQDMIDVMMQDKIITARFDDSRKLITSKEFCRGKREGREGMNVQFACPSGADHIEF
jgi:hypothetical protein